MNRSPLFYPLNRGADADAGGAADLQTDVMRFMAILSLCLVAIFALVQSIPPDAAQPPPQSAREPAEQTRKTPATADTVDTLDATVTEPTPPAAPKQVSAEPRIVDADDIDLRYPMPTQRVAAPPPDAVHQATLEVPEKPSAAARAADAPTETAPAKTAEGFSLRFADDVALTRLVARNEVGMYAMSANKAMRMNVNSGDIGFWSASTPKQFHEMELSTVPEPVLAAYRYGHRSASVKWAVTLPPGMTRQLNQLLSQNTGGAIIIDADGALRLDQ